MLREIVTIDEEKCDGCGLCVPACHEGAIRIVNGKAKLRAENLCDGLGACLGHCPQDAIRVERREADAFDERAVAASLAGRTERAMPHAEPVHHAGGCPSQRFVRLGSGTVTAPPVAVLDAEDSDTEEPSALNQWPVQLRLLPPQAPVFQNAHLLLTADCVPCAFAGFQKLLRGHALAIACPKLDDTSGYVAKLTEIIVHSHLRSLTVLHMEVPCCTGILMTALQARANAGVDLPIEDVVISTRGEVLQRRMV